MAIKQKVGVGKCWTCGEPVVWRKTEGGALSCFCQMCDLQAYAKDGTDAERKILATLGVEKPEATPAPEPENKPAPVKRSPFGLPGI